MSLQYYHLLDKTTNYIQTLLLALQFLFKTLIFLPSTNHEIFLAKLAVCSGVINNTFRSNL